MDQLDIFEFKIKIRELEPIPQDLILKLFPTKNKTVYTIYQCVELAKVNSFVNYSYEQNYNYYINFLNNLEKWFKVKLQSEEKEILLFYSLQRENFNIETLNFINEDIFFNYVADNKYLKYFQFSVQYEILLLYSQLVDIEEKYYNRFKEIFYIVKAQKNEYQKLQKEIGGLFYE